MKLEVKVTGALNAEYNYEKKIIEQCGHLSAKRDLKAKISS